MAATNFTPIQLYFSTTASAAPTAANLAQGELAINITDGKLYYEDNTGVVQVIATKGAGTIGGSTTQIQYNNAGALAGNAAMVFNSATSTTTLTTLNLTNALGAIYGGTAQSTYAQGDVVYASAANTLAKLGIGVVNYILTSTGSIPQWVAPSSIAVLTATNLAGGLAGSVPYQSALDTTTFLAIGAANRVMTSSGSAPQWVTSLTGLTGVSSSSITNTSLTSGRVVISSTAGLESDSANLTFNGTTLSTTGLSNSGFSTLVKTLTLGDTSFNGTAVFAAATPAKLYMGTGTVTDVTSAISATNTTGAIASLAITPIAATNTGVTYTNASTLYIAGAPSAGTNITITNPYSLYIAAGASYFGGLVTATGFAGPLNGTVGATTATTGAFTSVTSVTFINTSLAATDSTPFQLTGTTTGANRSRVFNTGGDLRFGIESNGGGSFLAGSAAYSSSIGSFTNTPFYLVSNSAIVGTVSSTGLAVTGALSATGNASFGTTLQWHTYDNAPYQYLTTSASGVGTGLAVSSTTFYVRANNTTVFESTNAAASCNVPLAVTGTLSATGTLSGGTSGTAYSFSGSAPATSLTLDASGNVGIGTSSPVGRLEAVGGTGAGFNGWFRTGDATAANNAGGGFYNNSSATAASRSAVMALDADGANLSGGDYFVIQKNGNSGTADILQYSNAPIRFGTNYTSRAAYDMTLDSAGNLGIGTSSPTQILSLSSADTTGTAINIINTSAGGYNWNIFSVGSAAALGPVGSLLFRDSTNGITRALIDSSGNLTISNGNLIVGTAGKGIDFSATSSGSGTMTSELLADYEEGSWTPTFQGNTTPGTITTSTLSANYTKVGRIVHIQVYAIFTVTVAGLGFLKATLPFSKAANTMFCGPLNTYNIDLPAGAVDSMAVPTAPAPSNDIVIFTVSTDNGTTGVIDASSLSTGDEMLFAFSYIAA